MSTRFSPDVLFTDDGFFIPMKFIEGMKFPNMEEEVFSTLKDDLFITVRTVGGYDYVISVEKQYNMLSISPINTTQYTLRERAIAIHEKWRYVISMKLDQ